MESIGSNSGSCNSSMWAYLHYPLVKFVSKKKRIYVYPKTKNQILC
nr:MAG TPA: hypothetical protein [Caudoviricetes sp.]